MKNILSRKIIFFIFLLTFFVWYPLISHALFGEGYYYFDRTQDFIYANGNIANPFMEYDILPRIIFDILPPIFGDQLNLYMIFQVVCMALLNVTLYYVLAKITKNRWVAFSAMLFFATSYVGLFEMLGTGNYQRFVQRVPQNIFILLAFLNLHYFLESKKRKLLFLSVTLFAVGVTLGHFTSFTMPLFFVYPFIWSLFNAQRKKIKVIFSNLCASILYFFVNYLIIRQGPHYPSTSLLEFISQWQTNLEKVLLQISNITIPTFIIERVASITNPYTDILIIFTVPIIFIHIFGFFVVRKRLPSASVLYATSLLLVPVFLLINLYFGKVDAKHNMRGYVYYFLPQYYTQDIASEGVTVRGDRYYFIPMIFFAIMWAILIQASFKKSSKKIFYSILAVYLLYNMNLIWQSAKELDAPSNDTKAYINYIKSISSEFSPKSIIASPRFFIWPNPIIRDFYGYPEMRFLDLKNGWDANLIEEEKENTFVIDYSYKQKTLIDKTQTYRRQKSIEIEQN